jgi:hypothetical protein
MGTQRLLDRIRRDFSPREAEAVIALLDELDDHDGDEIGLERVQAAVVILARGDSRRFLAAAALATRDWRDVLVAAGLHHEDWQDRLTEALNRGQDRTSEAQRR